MKIIGVSGLPGSGKSLVSNMAKKQGVTVIKMGDIVRKEAKKRNKDPGTIAIQLRKENGKYVIAKLTIKKIKTQEKKNNTFLIEGIRSPNEVKLFNKNFKNFTLISIFSTKKTRFNRIKKRNREDDSTQYKNFQKRDKRELKLGIGNVIATSNYIIINETSIGKYKNEIKKFLKKEIK